MGDLAVLVGALTLAGQQAAKLTQAYYASWGAGHT